MLFWQALRAGRRPRFKQTPQLCLCRFLRAVKRFAMPLPSDTPSQSPAIWAACIDAAITVITFS